MMDGRRDADEGGWWEVENMLNHSKWVLSTRKISFLFSLGASLSCCRNSSVSLDIPCRVTSSAFIVIHRVKIIAPFMWVLDFFFAMCRNSYSFNIFLRKVIRALEVCSAVPFSCVFYPQYGKNAKHLISREREKNLRYSGHFMERRKCVYVLCT